MARTGEAGGEGARGFWSGPLTRFSAAEDLSPFYQRRAERIATLLDVPSSGYRALDIGCGAGFLSERLAHQGHGVVALDLSAAQLDRARQRCHDLSVDLRCGGSEMLGVEERFDTICAIGVLPYLADPADYARGLLPHLAPGGRLILSLTRTVTPYVLLELFRHAFRFRASAAWWAITRNLARTGIWSGGFIDRQDWCRFDAAMLDAVLVGAGLTRLWAFGMFNLNGLDRWADRSRLGGALARRWGWSIVLAYQHA